MAKQHGAKCRAALCNQLWSGVDRRAPSNIRRAGSAGAPRGWIAILDADRLHFDDHNEVDPDRLLLARRKFLKHVRSSLCSSRAAIPGFGRVTTDINEVGRQTAKPIPIANRFPPLPSAEDGALAGIEPLFSP